MNKLKLYMLLTLLPLGLKPAAALTPEELLEENIQEQKTHLLSLMDTKEKLVKDSYDALLSLIDGALRTDNPAILAQTLKTINDSNEDYCFFVDQVDAFQQAKTIKQLQKIQGTIENQIKFVPTQAIKADLKKLSKAIESAINQFKAQEEDALLKTSDQKSTIHQQQASKKPDKKIVSRIQALDKEIKNALRNYADEKLSMLSYYELGLKRVALQAHFKGTFETNIYCPKHGFIEPETLCNISKYNKNKAVKNKIITASLSLKGHFCSFGQLENVPTVSFDLSAINTKEDFKAWLANTTDGIPTETKEYVNAIIETFDFSKESKKLAQKIFETNNWTCSYQDTERAIIELD